MSQGINDMVLSINLIANHPVFVVISIIILISMSDSQDYVVFVTRVLRKSFKIL